MSPDEVMRRDELLAVLRLSVLQNSVIQYYPISPAGMALISPAWRTNMSLTTKTRCGLQRAEEEKEDIYQHLTWLYKCKEINRVNLDAYR